MVTFFRGCHTQLQALRKLEMAIKWIWKLLKPENSQVAERIFMKNLVISIYLENQDLKRSYHQTRCQESSTYLIKDTSSIPESCSSHSKLTDQECC